MTGRIRLAGVTAVLILAMAAPALGQGLPGGPDLPPPDPTPARTPTPTPARTPAPTPQVQTPTGPTPAQLAQQRAAAAAAAARAAEAQRRAEAARRRREEARRKRLERGNEFRNLQAASDGIENVGVQLTDASQTLDDLAVSAEVAVTSAGSSDAAPAKSGHGPALMLLLLLASGFSAALALLPMGLRSARARHYQGGEFATDHRGVGDYVIERLPILEQRRVELAGVSVACLLVAVLIVVGLI